jgi:hypothetical protein
MFRFKSGLIYAVVPCIWKDSKCTKAAELRRIMQIYYSNLFCKRQKGTYNKTIGLFVRALFRLYKMYMT